MKLGSLARQYYKALIIGAGVAVLYSEVLRELAFDWWNKKVSQTQLQVGTAG